MYVYRSLNKPIVPGRFAPASTGAAVTPYPEWTGTCAGAASRRCMASARGPSLSGAGTASAKFRYQKGFIHAKTIIIDGFFASTGTANLDLRSFFPPPAHDSSDGCSEWQREQISRSIRR
ncbi:hypothetical protein [Paenibacillus turpanensis]|uniref:hypothetical protein n=1 Tax=Paenibacillus turpanensis TaxID=2689078 RepID=UPI00140CF176|nr:hypothetical protein [Paenibacillus turpanensis]